ncbi:MAG TPA: hypothetical protein VMI12_01565 [Puia sp.]|nr:hypothetical protein [Puia sp.]
MDKCKKIWLLLLALQLISIVAICQRKKTAVGKQAPPAELKAAIRVFTKSYGDSIVIRWAPTADWAWTSLNHNGYIIQRIDLSEAKHPKREIITPQPLKPLTLDQFKASFSRDNNYAAIAAQCLYGKNFSVNLRKGQGGQVDRANVWNMRFVYALQVADYDRAVAKGEALRFTDTKVQKNGVYIYRVYPAQLTRQGKIDTGNALVQNNGPLGRSKPKIGEVISRDKLSELHWNRIQEEQYSGYFIERSADGKNFSAITKIPYFSSKPDSSQIVKDTTQKKIYALLKTQQVFIDSLPQNYRKYYYRLKGINAFAEWSDYSDTLTAMGLDLTPPAAAIVQSPKFISGKKIELQWKKPLKEKDFKGYVVTRAKLVSGPYTPLNTKLLDPQAVQFTDTAAFTHGQNFYIVIALDTAGNMGPSIPAMGLVPDKTPPITPQGLKGRIDRKGLVHLSWNRNPDEDIRGYKIYYANANEHVYSQITIAPVTDTVFTDSITLHTLTKSIWYKIVAVDENNNHSPYSLPLSLKKPDMVPPMPPLASKVYVDTGGVQIDWIESSSTDVIQYAIYRKEKNANWTLINIVKHDTTKKLFHFTDKKALPFHDYNYCAEAMDEDSLRSAKSTPVNATIKTIPDLPAIKTLTASYDSKNKQVQLRWRFSDNGNYFFVLYKGSGKEKLGKFHSADSKTDQYFDDASGVKGNLRYAIQVFYKDKRGRTALSEPVSVTISSQ